MRKSNRRGLMAMEAIQGVSELGYNVDEKTNSVSPVFPLENAMYSRPVGPEFDNPGVAPGERISGGLNAHLDDIDDVKFFAGPLEPGEFPDINEDLNIIATLESQLLDLSYLEHDILGSKGMSQQFAMEAQKLIPDFDGNRPLQYYTVEPTATRYKVALEELSKGIWAAIAAGIVALLVAFTKLFSWITGGSSTGGSSGGSSAPAISSGSSTPASKPSAPASAIKSPIASTNDVKEAVKVVEKMPETVREFSKSLDLGGDAIAKADGLLASSNLKLKNEAGQEFSIRSFQDIIDHILTNEDVIKEAKRLLDGRNQYINDIITNGPFTHELMELVNKVAASASAITLKVNALETVIRKDLNSSKAQDDMENSAHLAVLRKPIKIHIAGGESTIKESASRILRQEQTLKDSVANKAIVFDKLFTTMAHAYKSHSIDAILHQANGVMKIVAEVKERLEKLQSASRNTQYDGVPGAMSSGMGGDFREVLAFVKEEGHGLGMIMRSVNYYFEQLKTLADHALGFGVSVVAKASSVMTKQGVDVPEGWKEVVADLHAQRDAITKAYRSMKGGR